jgi:hypothetical protein
MEPKEQEEAKMQIIEPGLGGVSGLFTTKLLPTRRARHVRGGEAVALGILFLSSRVHG